MTDLDTLTHATAISHGATILWVATYQDGSVFTQYQDGRAHSTEELDYSRLKAMALYHKSGQKLKEIFFEKGQYPIYRRRTAMRAGYGVLEVIHILGWRTKDPEANEVWLVYESCGEVEHGTLDGVGVRYPIQYLPHDEIPVS